MLQKDAGIFLNKNADGHRWGMDSLLFTEVAKSVDKTPF